MYKKLRLDNGLRVISHRMPDMRTASVGIWIKAGGRYESQKNKGIAHVCEHLLFKGSKKYSCRKIKESIEGVGGSLNGFTSEEFTCYLAKIPGRYLGLALDVLSDMVLNPLFVPEEIEKEKTVILEEIKMYKDRPQSYVHDLLDGLLWPDQPLGEPIIGSAESVGAVHKQDLNDFKNNFYAPANIVVSVAGLLDHQALAHRVSRIFSAQKERGSVGFTPAREMQEEPQLKILHKNTEQTHLALGFHALKRDHPLKHALAMLHIILGANMSSRLFDELREKRGLAYEIGTQIRRFQDTGSFVVHAGIDNRKVCESIRLILAALKKISHSLVTPDEFRRAKDFYLGQLTMTLEDTLDYMLWIGETTIALDKAYLPAQVIKEVKEVTREDIRKVARDIFREERINLSLIGPVKGSRTEIDKELRL